MQRRNAAALCLVWMALGSHASAQAISGSASNAAVAETGRFILLGTMGGPSPDPKRSQPSNVLVVGKEAYVIDCGDGTAGQLAKAHIFLPQVKAVVLSHLHLDHSGGLAALIGLRNQNNEPSKLKIYGPPGTRAMVNGLIAAMIPIAEAGYGQPGAPVQPPAETVDVVEVSDGDSFTLGPVQVMARQNSHYSFAVGSDLDHRFKSLSYRFNLPGRSIVYTGDTGPSAAVADLAKGADLLVSEMIDVDLTVGVVKRLSPDTPARMFELMVSHLSTHHLQPEQVGELAAKAGVKSLVITHLVAPTATSKDYLRYLTTISKSYRGPVALGNDLDEF